MSEEEFLKFCEEHGLDAESYLDDLVHDLKSQQASDVNNSGVEGQLAFLSSEGFGNKEIVEYLGTGGLTPDDIKKARS